MGVLLLCVSLVPASQAKDQDMVIRFGGMYAMGTGSYESTTIDEVPNFFNLGTLTADATQGYGAFIGCGWKPTDLVELDFGLSWFTMDFDVKDTETVLVLDDAGNVIDGGVGSAKTSADTTILPLTVGVNFHVVRGKKVDFYLGPVIGYAFLYSVDADPTSILLEGPFWQFQTDIGGELDVKDAFTYGALLGVDVPFGQGKWALSVRLEYLRLKAEAEETFPGEPNDINIDPVAVQIGAAYRF
jgi:outer membrane protein W